MCPITLAHWGHCSRESKVAGVSTAKKDCSDLTAERDRQRGSTTVPIIFLTWDLVIFWNLVESSACQVELALFTYSEIVFKSSSSSLTS